MLVKQKQKMVCSCAAYGCTNKWKADSEIRFSKIPKDNDLRQKRLNNIRREESFQKMRTFTFARFILKKAAFNGI